MRVWLGRWLLVISAALLIPLQSDAQTTLAPARIALVIGNSDYNLDGRSNTSESETTAAGFASDLPNPVNDAADVRDALTRLRFRVVHAANADRQRLGAALTEFGLLVSRAPANTVAVVYYAGHGIQVDGVNYLVPVGARLPTDQDLSTMPSNVAQRLLSDHAIAVRDVLLLLRQPSENGLNLVILDACRNNPWERQLRGAVRGERERGLADQPTDLRRTLIAFSTAPGRTASDGTGRNSPYTAALKTWLERPGLNVLQMLNNVGRDVVRTTGQTPWMNNAPIEDVCLAVCIAPPTEPTSAELVVAREKAMCEWLRDSARRGDFEDYMSRYGSGGICAGMVRAKLLELSASSAMRPPTPAVVAAPAQPVTAVEDPTAPARRALASITRQQWSTMDGAALAAQVIRDSSASSLRALADAGDSSAQCALGYGLRTGVAGLSLQEAESVRWIRAASERGHPRCQGVWGEALMTGWAGVAIDTSTGERLMRASIANGILASKFGLGQLLNTAEGLRLIREAADTGFAKAQAAYGTFLEYGERGAPTDLSLAARYYRLAADQGDPMGQAYLADFMLRGVGGVTRNPAEGARLMRAAADAGDVYAQSRIGRAFLTPDAAANFGLTPNPTEGVRFLRLATTQRMGPAYPDLAYALAEGVGTPRDVPAARALLDEGVRQAGATNGRMLWALASAYDPTTGRTESGPELQSNALVDREKAYALYRRAAQAGQPGAIYNAAMMFRDTQPRDVQRAIRVFEEGLAYQCGDCAIELAVIFWNRTDGVTRDRSRALRYLDQASRFPNLTSEQQRRIREARAIVD